jgi:hypothetical protein
MDNGAKEVKKVGRKKKVEIFNPEFFGESLANVDYPVRSQMGGGSVMNSTSAALRYPNLNFGGLPFQYQNSAGAITISDAVLLCQKAYCRVPLFKNSVDLMGELANTDVYLEGGTKDSQTFFEAWFKRINLFKLKDQFYRELFRSGNVFLYRIEGKMTPENAKSIKKIYSIASEIDLPLKYITLNPVNIAVYGDMNYQTPIYLRVLNPTEVELLRKSKDPQDQQTFKSLPDALKTYFNSGTSEFTPLDGSLLHTVFYKKQDYEPFAIPMGYPVLDSLELKLAMQKADGHIARTVEYAILLVTMGSKESGGTNPENLKLLKDVFRNDKLGRVLVSDYTTKAEFIIPDLAKVMGKEKYEVVNEDISQGLMNIFFGGDQKFANMMGKLRVFVEKINNAQEIFINEFLLPEIKRVSSLMGFKSYPIPSFVKIDLSDQTNILRIYTQLMQMGVLTPKDTIEAIEHGVLPDYETLKENQVEYKKDRDAGLFEPVLGGPFTQLEIADKSATSAMKLAKFANENADTGETKAPSNQNIKKPKSPGQSGRPPGTKSPQTTKNIKPAKIKASVEDSFSVTKLIEYSSVFENLKQEVLGFYKQENEVEDITEIDNQNISYLIRSICENETPEDWISKVPEYLNSPVAPNIEITAKIDEIALEYGVSQEVATILNHCRL